MKLVKPLLALLLLIVAVPFVAVWLILALLHRTTVNILVWTWWVARGKDVLFVSSDSPVWHDYMSSEILTLVKERAVTLNWSERKQWRTLSLGAQAFRSFRGDHDFNPLVIVFRPFRRARVFRFWSAFRDFKHGHPERLEQLKRELAGAL